MVTDCTEILNKSDGEKQPFGGKTKGLLRLMENGARVPPFYVVLPKDTLKSAADAYQNKGWKVVAVRSSALGEDGKEHSFAGMYCI